VRRRARKYVRGVVDQDQDFEAINRLKRHARFLAHAPRYLQCRVGQLPAPATCRLGRWRHFRLSFGLPLRP
jgi:hypothetical protein